MAWVTHLASPYRVPLWTTLALKWRIEVNIVESQLGRFGSENRGSDWAPRSIPGVEVFYLRTLLVHIGRTALHLLLPFSPRSSIRNTDVVLLGGWESPVYWFYAIAAKARRKPVVGFYESTPETRRFVTGPVARLQKLIFKSFDAVVVPGDSAAQAVADLGVPSGRTFVGFNAVDVNGIHEIASAARAQLGILSSRPAKHRLVYLGQLIERKRVAALIEVLPSIPDATLTIIGSGPEEANLRALIAERGLEERAHLRGAISSEEVPKALAEYELLCLVSSEEVWGLVINEALAAGLQIVVSENCGVARSVSAMQGVHIVDKDLRNLRTQIVAATRDNFAPITHPEILSKTPEAFAEVFDAAFRQVMQSRPTVKPLRQH